MGKKINYHKYMKFVPIVGIVVLFGFLVSDVEEGANTPENTLPVSEKLLATFESFLESFDFSDTTEVFFTTVLLITLWTGYKYWLVRVKYVQKAKSAYQLEKLIIAVMFVIFVTRHVLVTSAIGKYVDWILFLLFFYLVVSGSWFLAKTIDRIDLSSDLACWGLRLIGAVIVIFGVLLLMSSTFAITLSNSKLVLNNIYWIASVCIILLGCFMEYRSFRRHPAIHIW